jgi:hypothetical protein
MAKTLTPTVKQHLDTVMGNGGAGKIIALITSGTALDGPTRRSVEINLGGIGEGAAFITACTAHTALSTAAMHRLERHLHGRGNAEEFAAAVLDGTVT